jgi:antitoxin ParD1/3/4
MNISLTPELETFVEGKVKGGFYHSASEVIREGLRLLKERDALQEIRVEELRKQVREGFAQIERGDYLEFSSAEEIFTHITQEGRKRTASKNARWVHESTASPALPKRSCWNSGCIS